MFEAYGWNVEWSWCSFCCKAILPQWPIHELLLSDSNYLSFVSYCYLSSLPFPCLARPFSSIGISLSLLSSIIIRVTVISYFKTIQWTMDNPCVIEVPTFPSRHKSCEIWSKLFEIFSFSKEDFPVKLSAKDRSTISLIVLLSQAWACKGLFWCREIH